MTEDERLWYAYLERGRPPKKRGSVAGTLFTILFMLLMMGFFAVVIAMQFGWVPPLLLGPGLEKEALPVQAKPSPTTANRLTTGTYTAPAPVVAPLPDCATVQDTRTACQERPTVEAPAIPPTPPYLSSCITPPGERPCWLPADQAWEAPETVPETPVVLLPEPTSVPLVFVDAVCADWHPPQVLPEECKQ